MKRAALTVLLVVIALAGCGGETDPATTPAGTAQAEYLKDLYAGRYAQAYSTLHPTYKQIVSRSQFSDCAASTIPPGQLDSIEILDVFDDPVQFPGGQEQEANAVRVRLTSTSGETTEPFENHEVKVGDRWYWVLNESAVTAYKAGRCPGGA
ncbi:MAG: hypothetical protein AABM30_10210 [Actinomycetota bacterium]